MNQSSTHLQRIPINDIGTCGGRAVLRRPARLCLSKEGPAVAGTLGGITRMKIMAALLTALVFVFAGGCGKRVDAPASATISWIHPRLSQPTQPVAITDSSAVARLPGLFAGYDGPPPNVPAADPPMYDCVITMTSRAGTRTDIKVYLPRPDFFP